MPHVAEMYAGESESLRLTIAADASPARASGKLGRMDLAEELALRRSIMRELERLTAEQGFVSREQLSSLKIGDHRRRIVDSSKGIWNPQDLAATLSVVSSPDGPYDDADLDGGLFRYAYRAGSTQGDNTKLRRALELDVPIILLRKLRASVFVPWFPVFVIKDDPVRREFLLALDEDLVEPSAQAASPRRTYVERLVRQRLHQAEFRGRVLRAYETQCSVCNLRLGRLLEAAHIIGDKQTGGDPVVTNGLSLCKIHHAAYDSDLVGISPDFVVEINHNLLEITDGPMLRHGLQEMHKRRLTLPRRRAERPDRERLELRFAAFRAAS